MSLALAPGFSWILRRAALIASAFLFAAATHATTYQVLYHFRGGADGDSPSSLVAGPNGVLYGTTNDGGSTAACNGGVSYASTGCGIVFALTPPAVGKTVWTETKLYVFKGGTDGANPNFIMLGSDGALYGTTQNGGKLNCAGAYPTGTCGTVFKLTPPAAGQVVWTKTTLYIFKGGTTDGVSPRPGILMDASGAIYGVTFAGGSGECGFYNCGTVYKLTPPATGKTAWREAILHNFDFVNGDQGSPQAGLTMGADGTLYGTTSGGGAGGGNIFSLTVQKKTWVENVLHVFHGSDGNDPEARLTVAASGAIYGTTRFGGEVLGPTGETIYYGTLFELTPPSAGQSRWTLSVLKRFPDSVSDGAVPSSGLTADTKGNFFGVTQSGGKATSCPVAESTGIAGCGTIFSFSPTSGTEKPLHLFSGPPTDGAHPFFDLVFSDGALFGLTLSGGKGSCSASHSPSGCGVVFRLQP